MFQTHYFQPAQRSHFDLGDTPVLSLRGEGPLVHGPLGAGLRGGAGRGHLGRVHRAEAGNDLLPMILVTAPQCATVSLFILLF